MQQCCNVITMSFGFVFRSINWEVNRNVEGTPECLAHNIVSLCLPVKIVLVNSTHITVHIDADEKDREIFPEICSQVCKAGGVYLVL